MIVDASVAFKWVFEEDGSEAAAALLNRDDLRAPSLLLIEIGNGLWKKGMRGELGDSTAYALQIGLVQSLVTIVDSADVIARSLNMSLMLKHAIYDCVYLAIAERDGDQLISADRRFMRKVLESSLAGLVVALE